MDDRVGESLEEQLFVLAEKIDDAAHHFGQREGGGEGGGGGNEGGGRGSGVFGRGDARANPSACELQEFAKTAPQECGTPEGRSGMISPPTHHQTNGFFLTRDLIWALSDLLPRWLPAERGSQHVHVGI